MKQYLLSETDWNGMNKILEVLKPFYVYSTRLQAENTTLSDLYGFWIHINIKMQKISDSNLKKNILLEMDRRKILLLNNPIIIGAVFLDPRYQCLLDEDQRSLAIFFLKGVYQKLDRLENQQQENANGLHNESSEKANESNSSDEMSAYINSVVNRIPVNLGLEEDKVEQALTEFNGTLGDVKKPVLEYWEENKQNTILHKLSQLIYAVPPTQTTVERCFSALPLVLSSLRTSISDTNLNNILLIRSNRNLLQEIGTSDKEFVSSE